MINDIAHYRDILNRLLTEDEDIPVPPSRIQLKSNQAVRKFSSPELRYEMRYGHLLFETEGEFSAGGVDGWGRLDIYIYKDDPTFFAVELESMHDVLNERIPEVEDAIAEDLKKILKTLGLDALAQTLAIFQSGERFITYNCPVTDRGLEQLAKYGFKE